MTSMLAQFRAALLALLLATPATAQQIGHIVTSDLDGNGVSERFTLLDSGEGTVHLQIEGTVRGTLLARDIAWLGGIGQEPELTLADNGSVQLTSMNEAIGRHRWHMTLTIAYRRNDYRVAGFTYNWYDTIDIADHGICDLNLLTGRGYVQKGDGPRQDVRTNLRAIAAHDWTDTIPIPRACGLPN